MNMGSYSCCTGSTITGDQFDKLASTLKLVSEESRLRLMCLLCQGEHCVCDILPHLNMSQSLASHHLRDLKDAKIVTDRKEGLKVFYSLTPHGRSVSKLLFGLCKKETNENK